jgi:hypothetical protein
MSYSKSTVKKGLEWTETKQRLEETYALHPELEIDLNWNGTNLETIMNGIFATEKHPELALDNVKFRELILNRNLSNSEFIDTYISQYEPLINQLLQIDFDDVYLNPTETIDASNYMNAIRALNNYLCYQLLYLGNIDTATKTKDQVNQFTHRLCRGNLMSLTVGIASGLELQSTQYELTKIDPSIMPWSDQDAISALNLDPEDILKNEYAGATKMLHNFAEPDNQGRYILSDVANSAPVPLEIAEQTLLESTLFNIKTLETHFAAYPIDIVAANKESELASYARDKKWSAEYPGYYVSAALHVNWSYYLESLFKAQTIMSAQAEAINIAQKINRAEDLPDELPFNRLTGEEFFFDPETMLLHTGLGGSNATVAIPSSVPLTIDQ